MNEHTYLMAAQALGLTLWDLSAMLHRETAVWTTSIAESLHAGHPLDEARVNRIRRLNAAARAVSVAAESEEL